MQRNVMQNVFFLCFVSGVSGENFSCMKHPIRNISNHIGSLETPLFLTLFLTTNCLGQIERKESLRQQ